jgi:two-component system nitrate/nitrite response regulator NarL
MIATAQPQAEPSVALAPLAPLSVVLVEDHALYRETLARAIGRHAGLELVGEAADGIAGVELVAAVHPAVAVLDLRLPGLDGLAVCARLRAEHPDLPTRTLVLSAFDEPDLVWQCVAHGAAGFVDKQVGHREICDAIASVGAGQGFAERRSR